MHKFSTAAILSAAFLMTGLAGCASTQDSEEYDESMCQEIKPGTVTSVNHMCAVVLTDPVNPALTPVDWKSQKVGFCCKGCIPRWAAMTEAQKDAALAKAIAAGNPAAPATPASPAQGQPIW